MFELASATSPDKGLAGYAESSNPGPYATRRLRLNLLQRGAMALSAQQTLSSRKAPAEEALQHAASNVELSQKSLSRCEESCDLICLHADSSAPLGFAGCDYNERGDQPMNCYQQCGR